MRAFVCGVLYRLRLVNGGAGMHEFAAAEFFKAIVLRDPEVLERTKRDEVLLQPKEQKDVYFVAPKPGRFRLTCPNHDWDNMVGDITVE